MSAPTIFADAFDILELHCERRTKPSGHLSPLPIHREMTLPEDFGRAVLDLYRSGDSVVARLVSMKSGEVAWYDVSVLPKPSAESAA